MKLGLLVTLLLGTTLSYATVDPAGQPDRVACERRDHNFFQCFVPGSDRLPKDVIFEDYVDLESEMTVRTVLCDHGICRDVRGDGFFGSALHDGRYIISKGYYLASVKNRTYAFRNGTGPLKGVNPSAVRPQP